MYFFLHVATAHYLECTLGHPQFPHIKSCLTCIWNFFVLLGFIRLAKQSGYELYTPIRKSR